MIVGRFFVLRFGMKMASFNPNDTRARRSDFDGHGRFVEQITSMSNMPSAAYGFDMRLGFGYILDRGRRVVQVGRIGVDLHGVGHVDIFSTVPNTFIEFHFGRM